MAKMLRHVPTGDLYVYTEYLAKRDDMEDVVEPEVSPLAGIDILGEQDPLVPEPDAEVIPIVRSARKK